jgi:hypothetical protein
MPKKEKTNDGVPLKAIHKILTALFVSLTTSYTAFAFSAPDLSALEGKPLRAYPKLIRVSQTELMNVYWSNVTNCDREPENCDRIVDQKKAGDIQKRIEGVAYQKIANFDQMAARLFPNWSTEIRSRLFPLSIKIQLGDELINAGSVYTSTTAEIFSAFGT